MSDGLWPRSAWLLTTHQPDGMGTVGGTVTVRGEARIVDPSTSTEISIDNALDGVVLSLDSHVGDSEAGNVQIDGKTITEVKGQRQR